MAVLKDLIVHGNSRFLNAAYFNQVKANDLAAEQGYFNKLIAVDGKISNLNVDDLTAQNATVIGLLDVKGELHTNSWTNANIATIDGSFYITPTVSCESGIFAYDGTSITITAASGYSFGVDSLYTYTTSGTVTTYSSWPQYSRVLLTGEVKLNGSNEWQPLGTIRGQIVNSSPSSIKINSLYDSQGTTPIATLTDLGSTSITDANFRKIKVSLYERASSSSSFFPIGIYMTALGAKGKTFIDIYGGGDAKGSIVTNNIDSGAMAKPVLRIGNLSGLPVLTLPSGASVAPQGWGVYTNNGFFQGTIVSTQGKIGNFTISNDLYSGTTGIGKDTNVYVSPGITSTQNIADSGTSSKTWAFTAGANFGVTTNGTLYAKGAQISGNIAATTGSISSSVLIGDNNQTVANMLTNITNAATTASKYITYIDADNGIRVYDGQTTNKNVNFTQINSTGMQVYVGGIDINNQVAQFGAETIVGNPNQAHISISNSEFSYYDNNPLKAFSIEPGEDTQNQSITYQINKTTNSSGSIVLRNDVVSVAGVAVTVKAPYQESTTYGLVPLNSSRTVKIWNDSSHTNSSNMSFSFSFNSSTKTLNWTISNAGAGYLLIHAAFTTVPVSLPVVVIGNEENSYIQLDYHSLQMIDKEGSSYFEVKDLRNNQGVATITSTFIGDGTKTGFTIFPIADSTNYTVEVSDSSGGEVTKATHRIDFATAPTDGAIISINYTSVSKYNKAYTLGTRGEGNIGAFSCAIGNDIIASGSYSHAEGDSTTASGKSSHAEGHNTIASDAYTHAEGYNTVANRYAAHAEGYDTQASGLGAHAEGQLSIASNTNSHAEGYNAIANGFVSHAEGYFSKAYGRLSHAEGYYTNARGEYSHTQNYYTVATESYQTVIGKFNKATVDGISYSDAGNYAFIIGNGTADTTANRSNALTVDWDGNVNIASGAKYKINGNALSASDVGAVPTSRTVNGKALSSNITLSASDVSALATSAAYTRSSAGTCDWSNQTDGNAKVIMKSALAYWNGAYSGTSSNLAYCNKGAFGTLATKNSLSASDVSALPSDYFIWDTYSKSITVSGGATNITMGTLTQHSGYTLRGYINQNGGYTDQWLVSYGTYGSNVVAMVYSKYNSSLTSTISCIAVWTKN